MMIEKFVFAIALLVPFACAAADTTWLDEISGTALEAEEIVDLIWDSSALTTSNTVGSASDYIYFEDVESEDSSDRREEFEEARQYGALGFECETLATGTTFSSYSMRTKDRGRMERDQLSRKVDNLETKINILEAKIKLMGEVAR